MVTLAAKASGYTGLADLKRGLPAEFYYDTQRHALELTRLWLRNWLYVSRSSELPQARSFLTFAIGDQNVLLVRQEDGQLRAFHNTCRHRGAQLCRESSGALPSASVVCPYHAWVYGLDGALVRTSSKTSPSGFERSPYSLYAVPVHEWRGFVFVCLDENPRPFEDLFDVPLTQLDAWPLENLVVGHVLMKTIQCNWKIFWENYNECLHCPTVHPQLARLVPIYGRGLLEERDDPDWETRSDSTDPAYRGGLRPGASSWTLDGQSVTAPFATLSKQQREAGHTYLVAPPSMTLVAHVDYVRVMRLRPLGPEQTELRVEYLFAPATLDNPHFDLRNAVDFTDTVMGEDVDACEMNQRGLRAIPHARGVVMPEEYLIEQLHRWIAEEIARD